MIHLMFAMMILGSSLMIMLGIPMLHKYQDCKNFEINFTIINTCPSNELMKLNALNQKLIKEIQATKQVLNVYGEIETKNIKKRCLELKSSKQSIYKDACEKTFK